jgi:hypothetical protein
MGYYLLGHGGSADHSSEDRIRGICRFLPEKPELYSTSLEEDWRYGLGELAALNRLLPDDPGAEIGQEDWCVMLRPAWTDKLRKAGHTLLWGWTPVTEGLSRRLVRQLKSYRAVIVPDQKSVELLHTAGLRKNVRLGPEPAFLVQRQLRALRGGFRQDTVGVCFSPAVCRFERTEGLLYRSYCHLIRWILDHTTWQIALIPYCVKPCCNDELLQTLLLRHFCHEERLLRRDDGDCRVLRGDISLCRCCVGTAGVLAGWSCGVPGVCVGSSVRARNLSRALFGTLEPVVGAGSLRGEEELTNRFRAFLRQEEVYRQRLERSAAQYRRWAMDWTLQDAV